MTATGILLINTGTPEAPTTAAVRHYLREFLSDSHVVKIPKIIWLPILYGLILTTRPQKSATLYQKIWTKEGSPLRANMITLAKKLSQQLSLPVEIGMNYCSPSIAEGIDNLQKKGCDRLIFLPLFPQYSDTTTGSAKDLVTAALKKNAPKASHEFIRDYASLPAYIQALANKIKHHWEKQGRGDHLLISFHGIPERFVKEGDPYQSQCEQTTRLLVKELNLSANEFTLCYQSQFGYDKWLQPSTQQLFRTLPARGIKTLDIICPGFAIDCLETLEEIAITGQKIFHEAGGLQLRYIPALNDDEDQVSLLCALISV